MEHVLKLVETCALGALFFYHMYAVTPRLDKLIVAVERRNAEDSKRD